MRKGPCRFGSSAQKYQSKLGRRFLEEHHKPPSNTGIPPQKSEPKIGLVTKTRLFSARRFARALCKVAKFSGTNGFAEHSKHDRSRLFEITRGLARFNHVASGIVNPDHGMIRPAVKLGVSDCVRISVYHSRPNGGTSEIKMPRRIH